MKKTFFLFLFMMFVTTHLFAGYKEYRIEPKGENSFKVFGRGILNGVGLPLEVVTTGVREYQMHSRLWPITYIPRILTNVICRTASAGNDALMLPWYAPFTSDTDPWTKGIGLPTYPWSVNP